MRDGRLIADGEHVLEMQQQMTSTDTEVVGYKGELKKMMFSCRTRVVSTVHLHDDAYNAFMRNSVRGIAAVSSIAPRTVIQLFPVIIAQLFALMTSTAALQHAELGGEAFAAVLHVLQVIIFVFL